MLLVMNIVFGAVGAKEVTAIDKFVDFFDKLDPFTTFALALFNFVFVVLVFRFNKKMSQSKLSISVDSIKSNTLIVFNGIDHESGISHEKLYKRKLLFKEEGFPIPGEVKNADTIFLKVTNRGDLPSTNIKISLELRVYKTKNTYIKEKDAETLDVSKEKRERYITGENEKININIDYMGADEERRFDLFEIHGQIRELEIILLKIKANGHTYFKNNFVRRWYSPTMISYYKHPELSMLDNHDDPEMILGSKKMWNIYIAQEKQLEEEERKRIEASKDYEAWQKKLNEELLREKAEQLRKQWSDREE